MGFRCWQHSLAFLTTLFLVTILPSLSTPIFKIKHYSYFKPKGMPSPVRSERRLVGGSSPIHFISPFISSKLDRFEDFFVPPPIPMQAKPRSSIFKLPLQMLANGKPHTVIKGFPTKHKQASKFWPSSNIIKLPLKFISNGKPVRVHIKDRSPNVHIKDRSPNHL